MKITETQIKGLYQAKGDLKTRLVTENKNRGVSVYGEQLITVNSTEYRVWDPHRSKYVAGYLSGLKSLPQIYDKNILYLGVSTGTTVSHFSDILINGLIYGVEFSPKVMRRFTKFSEQRQNIIPLLADARRPEQYSTFVFEVDLIYQDVAQPDQAAIFGRNAQEYLKPSGEGILALKSQSVDVVLEPDEVFSRVMTQLEQTFDLKVVEYASIDTFAKKHALIVVKKE